MFPYRDIFSKDYILHLSDLCRHNFLCLCTSWDLYEQTLTFMCAKELQMDKSAALNIWIIASIVGKFYIPASKERKHTIVLMVHKCLKSPNLWSEIPRICKARIWIWFSSLFFKHLILLPFQIVEKLLFTWTTQVTVIALAKILDVNIGCFGEAWIQILTFVAKSHLFVWLYCMHVESDQLLAQGL